MVVKIVSNKREEAAYRRLKKQGKTLYFMGVLPGSPIQNAHVAGIEFQAFRNDLRPNRDKTKIVHSPDLPGKIMGLHKAQIDEIIKRVPEKMIRWSTVDELPDEFGEDASEDDIVRRGAIYIKGALNYEPIPEDEPLSRYLYLVTLDEMKDLDIESGEFPPSIEEKYLKKDKSKKEAVKA